MQPMQQTRVLSGLSMELELSFPLKELLAEEVEISQAYFDSADLLHKMEKRRI